MTLTAEKTVQQMESLVNHIGWAAAEHVLEVQNLKKKKKLVFFNFQ